MPVLQQDATEFSGLSLISLTQDTALGRGGSQEALIVHRTSQVAQW